MTDRELLAAAAKAAEIAVYWAGDDVCARHATRTDPVRIYWNPLAEDGDALRLANLLRLTIYHDDLSVIVKHKRYSWEWLGEMVNEDSGDRNAATRRAIVRAAAEIGLDETRARADEAALVVARGRP